MKPRRSALPPEVQAYKDFRKDIGLQPREGKGRSRLLTTDQIVWAEKEVEAGRTKRSVADDLGVSPQVLSLSLKRLARDRRRAAGAQPAGRAVGRQ